MAGKYQKVGYISDDGQRTYGILIQPETRTLSFNGVANEPQNNNFTGLPRVVSAGSRKAKRPVARRVVFRFTAVVPDGYNLTGTLTLPWLNRDTWRNLFPEMTGSYLGVPVKLSRLILEKTP